MEIIVGTILIFLWHLQYMKCWSIDWCQFPFCKVLNYHFNHLDQKNALMSLNCEWPWLKQWCIPPDKVANWNFARCQITLSMTLIYELKLWMTLIENMTHSTRQSSKLKFYKMLNYLVDYLDNRMKLYNVIYWSH